MSNLKVDQKVAKFSSNNEYFTGIINKIKDNKALVYFESRGDSRWCNLTNLESII